MNSSNDCHRGGLLLPGLDGSNPLGFLAAIGLFRVIHYHAQSAVRMRWEDANGTWIPRVHGFDGTDTQLLDILDQRLHENISEHPIRILELLGDDDSQKRITLIRETSSSCSASSRDEADWIAALASDVIPPTAINQLQTTRRDYHYGNLSSVIDRTKRTHLERALFSSWDYADGLDNQSLHLDPSEDRRHAHQWNKPAGDPNRKKSGGMLGANRLAIEAFPIFTSVPHGDALHTLGFTGQRSTDTRWTWPIWDTPISLAELPSVLGLEELQNETIHSEQAQALLARGIVGVYRTWRILVGKTPNFTPAENLV